MERPVDPQSQASAREDTDDNLAAAYSCPNFCFCPIKGIALHATCCSLSLITCAANHQQLRKCAIPRYLNAVGNGNDVVLYDVRFPQSRPDITNSHTPE